MRFISVNSENKKMVNTFFKSTPLFQAETFNAEICLHFKLLLVVMQIRSHTYQYLREMEIKNILKAYLQKNVSLGLLPILDWVVWFSVTEYNNSFLLQFLKVLAHDFLGGIKAPLAPYDLRITEAGGFSESLPSV